MKVGIVVPNNYPHDEEVRPRKTALALHRLDHKTIMIAWNSEKNRAEEDIGYARVYRFGYFLRSKFYKLLSHPFPLNFLWVLWIMDVARKESLDFLVSSNIRIAIPTILASKILKIPMVLDLQENNPEAVRARGMTSVAHYIVRNPKLVFMLEQLCVRMSSHVWVVVEERVKGLLVWGVKERKISVVSNCPDLESMNTMQETDSPRDGADFALIYVGRVEKLRGLDLILRSMPYILKESNEVKLLIVGDGFDRTRMEDLVSELGIKDHVVFTGWIDFHKVPAWIKKADVGIIFNHVNEFTNTTIPNKLFDYMALGLPVLATDMKPVRRIVEQEKCGVIVPLNSSYEAVADTILELKNSPEKRIEMGKNGRNAVLRRYNWDVEFREVLSTFDRLGNSKP